jgi:hypothetical protein
MLHVENTGFVFWHLLMSFAIGWHFLISERESSSERSTTSLHILMKACNTNSSMSYAVSNYEV